MVFERINALIVILIFGSLLLLAFVGFTNPLNVNRKGNRWIAVLFLFYASFWAEEIAVYTGVGVLNSLILVVIHSAQIFAAMVFYFSILNYTVPNYTLRIKQIPHLIVPLVYICIQIYQFIEIEKGEVVRVWGVVIILSLSMFYALLSYIQIRKHQKRVFIYSSNTQGIELHWLEYIILQIIAVCVIVVLHNIFMSTVNIVLLINIVQLITIFSIAYFSLKQKEIFPVKDVQRNELKFISEDTKILKQKRKVVQDEELESQKNRLVELMRDFKPYLDSELNLVGLAKLMNITPHQLSYIINTGYNENFFQFVNRYRVEKAKELLLGNENLTMLAIAFDSGFNSKTAFNTTFKKLTQQTPSQFKKACSNL